MDKRLFFSAITKFILGVTCTATLLFIPAGTIHFPAGQRLLLLLFVPMFFAGLVMMAVNPALLLRRLSAKEPHREQQRVVVWSGLMFVCGFVAAGLDFRFGWSHMPRWLSVCSVVIFVLAYALYAEVLRENTWLSRTIEVQKSQVVVDRGLYSVIRHPMYTATILLFLSMPLILGSWVSFVLFLPYPFLMVKRIQHEEQVLEAELDGYADYKTRVIYRLLPYIW